MKHGLVLPNWEKKQAVLNLYSDSRSAATEAFLQEHSGKIEAITGRSPDPKTNTIARLAGRGWEGNGENWVSDIAMISACVSRLTPLLSDLIAAVRHSFVEELSDRGSYRVEIPTDLVIRKEPLYGGEKKPRPGVIQRIFGRK